MDEANEHKPFHLATFALRADGVWRLRRAKKAHPGVCGVAWCTRERRADRKSLLCHTCESREWRANHPVRAAFLRLRSHAKARGILFDLSFDQFSAFVTSPRSNGYMEGRGHTLRHHLHIDRVNNTKGYSLDNIQVLTLLENCVKRGWDEPRRNGDPF